MANFDNTGDIYTDELILKVSKKYMGVTGETIEEFALTLSEIAFQDVSNSFDSCLSQTVNVV